ncbi:CAP domain-containing protein [Strongyloides ratti]|nr:CAP domain-containing protein [Strongyloides ratti]CEF68196.1 CAP domain-containing protein [Strongyloides ratti]
MLDKISEENPHLIGQKIYLHELGYVDRFGETYSHDEQNVKILCLQKSQFATKVREKVIRFNEEAEPFLIKHDSEGQISYECSGKTTTNLPKALACGLRNELGALGPSCSNSLSNKQVATCASMINEVKNVCREPDNVMFLNLKQHLGKDSLSNTIWMDIWRYKCDIECFILKQFRLLKERFLREINAYRSYHKAYPLIESYDLSLIAQAQATKMASLQNVPPLKEKKFTVLYGKDDLLFTPLMIKRWYEEILTYNFKNIFFKPTAHHFTTLVWKSSKVIGMGIAKRDCKIYAVFIFQPKANVVAHYKINVSPRIF